MGDERRPRQGSGESRGLVIAQPVLPPRASRQSGPHLEARSLGLHLRVQPVGVGLSGVWRYDVSPLRLWRWWVWAVAEYGCTLTGHVVCAGQYRLPRWARNVQSRMLMEEWPR